MVLLAVSPAHAQPNPLQQLGNFTTQQRQEIIAIIRDALRSTRGDVKSCLEILRIPRKTFYDKVTRHGIDLDAFRRPSL